ncbi:MAG: aryl-sulfate sulfotransferase [Chitinispirillaceae bacterium]|nr:aryl-sulfate sulfotransferase [Chitinispirillaceae bacterium]
MINKRISSIIASFLISSITLPASASLSDGYILYGTYDGKTTILLDKNGEIVHTWTHTSKNGYVVYMLESGNILRSGVVANNVTYPTGAMPLQEIIEEVDSSSGVVWTYQLSNENYITHHDMKPMPDGHILACAFELMTREKMIAAGIDTALLTGGSGMGGGRTKTLLAEMIFELDPHAAGGPKIVWEWHIWDHVVPKAQAALHPELFSGSLGPAAIGQWVHLNGIDYCAKTDLIVFTSRLFSEVYVIDHGTTTQQAAGHTGGRHNRGGDLLYRWGRAFNYLGTGDTIIKTLHCPTWIPDGYPGAGNILFFHNNTSNPMTFTSTETSQVIEINPPRDADGGFMATPGTPFGPDKPDWIYDPDSNMFSGYMSSAFRLKNGNTLVHECQGARLREVTPDGRIVWMDTMETGSSGGMMAAAPPKIMYYPGNYPGVVKLLHLPVENSRRQCSKGEIAARPSIIRRSSRGIEFSNAHGSRIAVYTLQGKIASSLQPRNGRAILRLPPGVSVVRVTSAGKEEALRVVTVER